VNVLLTQFNLSKTAGFFFGQFHGMTFRSVVFVMPLGVKVSVQGRLHRMNPDRVSPANRRIRLLAVVGLLSALLRIGLWDKVFLFQKSKTLSYFYHISRNRLLISFGIRLEFW